MKFHMAKPCVFVAIAVLSAMASDAFGASLNGSLVDLVVCKSPGKATSDVAVIGASKSPSAGKAVRTLRVYETKSGEESGCLATYSKTNVEKTVGTSRQTKQCQTILEGIRKNLEASKWACKQAASPSVVKSALAANSDVTVDAQASEADDLEKELNKPEASTVR